MGFKIGAFSKNTCTYESKCRYVSIAALISLMQIYSSAEWERADCPGPSLNDGMGIRAWSLNVGEPKGVIPIAIHFWTRG